MTTFDRVSADIFQRGVERRYDDAAEEVADIMAARSGDDDATIRLMYAYATAMRNGVRLFTASGGQARTNATDLEDVRQSVMVGFMAAIKAFDPANHHRLAAVVHDYIVGEVAGGSTQAVSFRVPERTMKRFWQILREADGDVLDAARLAPTYHMTAKTFMTVLSAVRNVSSYSTLAHNHNADTIAATMLDNIMGSATALTGSVRSDVEIVEDAELVRAAFRAVDAQEEQVCRHSYGFHDYEAQSDAEVAHRLGLSRPKVQRVRSSALAKMRDALGVA